MGQGQANGGISSSSDQNAGRGLYNRQAQTARVQKSSITGLREGKRRTSWADCYFGRSVHTCHSAAGGPCPIFARPCFQTPILPSISESLEFIAENSNSFSDGMYKFSRWNNSDQNGDVQSPNMAEEILGNVVIDSRH